MGVFTKHGNYIDPEGGVFAFATDMFPKKKGKKKRSVATKKRRSTKGRKHA